MSDLSDDSLIGWLQRQVAVPGMFTSTFPESSDDDITGALCDGFCRAQLDGWLAGVTLNLESSQTTPDISLTAQAIVVIYTSINWIQNQLTNLVTSTKYEAPGPVIAESQRSASVLAERLKELQEDKNNLLVRGLNGGGTGTPVFMRDGYAIRIEELYYPEAMVAFWQSPLELL